MKLDSFHVTRRHALNGNLFINIRYIICRYCHLTVVAGPVSKNVKDLYANFIEPLCEHESECGSRTISCQKCNKQVQLKDVTMHFKFHQFELKSKVMYKCSNKKCSNVFTTYPNEMKICAVIIII